MGKSRCSAPKKGAEQLRNVVEVARKCPTSPKRAKGSAFLLTPFSFVIGKDEIRFLFPD